MRLDSFIRLDGPPSYASLFASKAGKASIFLAAGVLVFLFVSTAKDALTPIEERLGALGWTLFSEEALEERITLVVIDETSISEIGPWPWSRRVMADLVSAIDRAGAQLQIHDVVYPEPRAGDEIFQKALVDASGAIIAHVPALNSQSSQLRTGSLSHGLISTECGSTGLRLATTNSFVAPASAFLEVPKGHNAALIDRDGGVRRSPALVCVDGSVYPSLALSAFMQLSSSSDWSVSVGSQSGPLQSAAQLGIDGYPGLTIPVDDTGAMRIDFRRSPEAFRAVSASEVLSGEYDPDLFENSWVILGGTAFGMTDIVPTPYSGAAFGVELQARMLASILDMRVPYTPAAAQVMQVLLASVFAVILYSISVVGGRAVSFGIPSLALALPACALCAHVYILANFNIWIGWIAPAIYGSVASVGILLVELARARFERARVYQNLASYLSPAVAREVAFSIPSSQVEAKRRDLTLLSADIRNFSAFGESRPPEEIAAILHFFNLRVNETVEDFGGRVVEVRGDSVLAAWDGASTSDARRALNAAKCLQTVFNEQVLAEQNLIGLEPMALGIGIEQGPVLMGSIGPSHRRSFSILGDTVSTTIRIQEMTSELAQPILLGSTISRQLASGGLESQGSYLLPGLSNPHTLFAPSPSADILQITAADSRKAI